MIRNTLSLIFILLFIVTNFVHSQNLIQSTKINPLNRVTIYFKSNKIDYSTKLSDDKKQIEFIVKNASIAPQLANITSGGIIKEVNVNKANNSLIINLKEARGYTVLKMEMSNSIFLEVFDWNKLNSNEEHYRNALLALEDNIYSIAYNELKQINLQDYPNAAAILGLLQLKSGDIKSAKENLLIASNSNSNITDIYSALAQIYKNESNSKQNDFYLNKFSEITGTNQYNSIEISNISLNDSSNYDSLSYLATIENHSNDSATTDTKIDTSKIQNSNTSVTLNAKKESSFFDNKVLMYVIFAIAILTLMLFTTFLKWRKNQLNILQAKNLKASQSKNTTTNKYPYSNKSEYPNKIKNNNYNEIDESLLQNNITNEKPIHPALQKYLKNSTKIKQNENSTKSPTPIKKNYKENQQEILKLLDNILEKNKNKQIIESKLENEKNKYKKNPNLDLALSLQKKQQDLKSERISNINENTDSENLKGINSNTINAKKKINKLENNKSEIEKLAEKINKNE